MSSTKPQPPRRIGFIGKAEMTPYEAGIFWYLGRCIARLGHTVVMVPAKGTATALREGVEAEGGTLVLVDQGTIEQSDHTQIYSDPQLLKRLRAKYKDLDTRTDVVIIRPDQLDEWYDAVKAVVRERGLELP